MTEMTDWQLIQKYVQDDAQAAFGGLVRRHTDLVYGTCLRETGDPSLAEEATQAVFLILARKAQSFRPGTTLSSWLFQTALLTSKNVLRRERRRQTREQRMVAEMERTMPPPLDGWEEMEPLLNEALQALSAAQCGLVLERFGEGRPLAEIGAARGISEDAARMRLNRALDRLRRWFAARNVVLSAAALAILLPQTVRPAPARCAEAVLRLALPPAASDSPIHAIAQGAIHTMNLKRLRLQLGAAALVAALSLGTAGAVRVTTQIKARAVLVQKRLDQARALAVLDRMYATYAAMHSFRCSVRSHEDPLSTDQEASYEIERPNKIHFRRATLLGDPEMSGNALAVSDGNSLSVTCTENKGLANHYAKMPLSRLTDYSGWFETLGGIPSWGTQANVGMPDVLLGIRPLDSPSPQLSAAEYSSGQPTVIDFSGIARPVPLDVVVARMHELPLVGAVKDDIVTYYIGQKDHLLYKVTAAYMVGPTQWDTRTETYNSIEVNPKLAPSDFVFTPPPGSHEVGRVSDLFPGGRM
jgi:RNA polymerase sigma factor (sigma-70 family)